jgi:dTDP-4-amino-4,6-dideoxygalactose transaminase
MFNYVEKFETLVSEFFGAPYGIATDSCTHGLELCLRYEKYTSITIPSRTYVSVPMTAMKLGIHWSWVEDNWEDYYYLGNTNIIDAAVLWKRNSYVSGTYMSISFQFKKHLSLGRGGIILTDNKAAYQELKKMVYDGRDLSKPWTDQDITTLGYHYYMTPETAIMGIENMTMAVKKEPKKWSYLDYPELKKLSVFR